MAAYSQIGEMLKEARLERGYTLDDLQQKTKIQRRYLIAIEEGKVEDLPDRFSIGAFIRQYAAAVGMDGDPLLEDTELSVGTEVPIQQGRAGEERVTRAQQRQTRQQRAAGEEWLKHANLPTYLLVLLVLLILAVGWYYLYIR